MRYARASFAIVLLWAVAVFGAPTQETPVKMDRVQVRSDSGTARIIVDFPYNGDSNEKKMNMGEECTDNPCSAPNLATKVAALDGAGFDIITVENTNNNPPADPGGHGADVFIGEIEESTSYIHLEVFDVATTIAEISSTSPRSAQEVVDYVRAQGGLVFLGHPAFTQAANNIESVIGLHGLDGVDIWDDITSPQESLTIATRYLDRAVMSGGRRVVLVAEADCQGTNGLCTGVSGTSNGAANFLYAPAGAVTKNQVKQLLSDGNFIASTCNTAGDYLLPSAPPALSGLTINFTTKSLGAGTANAECQWIGFGNTVLETDSDVSASVAASYTIKGGEGYVFARCTRDAATTTDIFWTQPAFVSREPFRAGAWGTISSQLWDIVGSNWLPHEIRTSPGTRFLGSTEDSGGDSSYPMWIFDTVLAPAVTGDYIEFHVGGTGQPTIANTNQTTRRAAAKAIIDADGTIIARSASAGHAGTINYATATSFAMPDSDRFAFGAPANNDYFQWITDDIRIFDNNGQVAGLGGCTASGITTKGACVDGIEMLTADTHFRVRSRRTSVTGNPGIAEYEVASGQTFSASQQLVRWENTTNTDVDRLMGDGAHEFAANLSRAAAQNARFVNVPVGTAAPGALSNGDLWATVDNFTTPASFSVFGRVNGVTVRTPAGDTAGACLSGDTATAFFSAGQVENARGGTGIDSSALTGVARVAAGVWSADAGISHLATSTSADLAGVLSNEVGTGAAVFATDAPLAGNPTAPTPAADDDDTSIATTAFVNSSTVDFENKTVDAGDSGVGTTRAAGGNIIQARTHDTDCTTLTDGKQGEQCIDEDDGKVWGCIPTAGDCSGAEWKRVDSEGAGGGDAGSVDGAALTDFDLHSSLPAALENGVNVEWRTDLTQTPDRVSGYIQAATATLGGIIHTGNQDIAGVKTFKSQITSEIGGADGLQSTSFLSDRVAPSATGQSDGHTWDFEGTSRDGGGAHTLTWRIFTDMTSDAGAGRWLLLSKLDAGAFTDRFSITDAGIGELDIFNATTGFRIGGAAASGNYLRGNGTNFVSAVIADGDIPSTIFRDSESLAGDVSGTAGANVVDDVQTATTNTEAADNDTTQVASTAFIQQEINGAGGAGLACASGSCATASSEQNFLASGALTCGASTAGKAQVHTTPFQYCDNAATPALQYAAYASSTGVATSATVLAANAGNCSAGSGAGGVDASGAGEDCTNYAEAADTMTFTNKTLDVEGTGNVITTVSKVWLLAATCQNATATANFDTPTANAPAAACVTGTDTQKAYLDFDQTTDESVQGSLMLPADWTGAIDVTYKWLTTAITGSATWCLQLICVADAETGDPAFPAQASGLCVSDAAKGTTLQYNDATDTGVTATGCAAGELMYYRISRDPDATAGLTDDLAADARLVGAELTLRRNQ